MALSRGIGRSLPDGSVLGARAGAALEERRRAISSTRLGVGTLACSRCDAPIATGPEPLSAAAQLTCPYCGTRAALREFLSLGRPTRPARVVVNVRLRTAGRVAG